MNLATGTVGGKLSVSAAIALSRQMRERKLRSSEHARAGEMSYNSDRAINSHLNSTAWSMPKVQGTIVNFVCAS